MGTSKKLKKVYLSADVYALCLQHALSTEKEEVMGLLIGDVDEDDGISKISSCLILRRSDKQADRVEISPEQLMAAATYAEQLEKKLKRTMRVVGWYHSHPHITVWPSRVDVRTQASYEKYMDPHFVGLIFSVFPNETRNSENNHSKSNEVQLTCFQSQGDGNNAERLEIPIYIRDSEFTPYSLEMMAQFPKILRDEEDELSGTFLNENREDVDPLIEYHNKAHKFSGMVHIAEKVARPIYESAIARETANQDRIEYLKKEKLALLKELKQLEISVNEV